MDELGGRKALNESLNGRGGDRLTGAHTYINVGELYQWIVGNREDATVGNLVDDIKAGCIQLYGPVKKDAGKIVFGKVRK